MTHEAGKARVLVTGAAGGIGRATAEAFHAEGYAVVLADRANSAVTAVAEELDDGTGRASAITFDLRDVSATLTAFAAAADDEPFGILVNNAGVTHLRTIWEITPTEWDEALEVNLRGAFFLTQAAAPQMKAAGWGRIINIASVAGQAPRPSGAHYGASKAGVISVTRAFAAELASFGVTVNAVAPGLVDTPMSAVIPAAMRERLLRDAIPIGRSADPSEIASAILFLASTQADYITGATLDINGGAFMR